MKSTDIKDIIKTFMLDKKAKSILIDGPWGCGKTYQIKKFLEETTDVVYYQSLFGLETIDEINTALYNQIHPNKTKIYRVLYTSAKLISKIKPAFEQIESQIKALEYLLEDGHKIDIKGTIIFDDLERLSKNVSYVSLMGYFYILFRCGVRIICVINSENLESELINFNKYKEKLFDRIYMVNEVDENIFKNLYIDLGINGINNYYGILENNLRMANKVKVFYKELINFFEKNYASIKNTIVSELFIFRAVCYCLKVSLKHYDQPENIENETRYNKDVKLFGRNIANAIYSVYYQESHIYDIHEIFALVRKLLHLFLYKDDGYLHEYFFPQKLEDEYEILNTSIFYMSTEKRKIYCEKFEKFIEHCDCNIREINKKITDIINYTSYEFKEKTLDKIADIYLAHHKNYKDVELNFNLIDIPEHRKAKKNKFIDRLEKSIKKITERELLLSLETEIDYSKLLSILMDIKDNKEIVDMEKIKEILIRNNFYLPDLSKEINDEKWDYSHKIAQVSKELGFENEFIELAKKLCEKNKDETLIDRLFVIIYYNINNKFEIENLLN